MRALQKSLILAVVILSITTVGCSGKEIAGERTGLALAGNSGVLASTKVGTVYGWVPTLHFFTPHKARVVGSTDRSVTLRITNSGGSNYDAWIDSQKGENHVGEIKPKHSLDITIKKGESLMLFEGERYRGAFGIAIYEYELDK